MFDCTCLDKYGNTITALYQWDTNQTLYIEDHGFTTAPFFHFCNKDSDRALKVLSSINVNGVMTVTIPNELLQKPYPITAYVYLIEDEAGSTVEVITIPVRPRPMPEDSEYATEAEITTIVDLEARASAAIGQVNVALAEVIQSETIRVDNENERVANEMTRVANEKIRQENEAKRSTAIAEAQVATERANVAAEACEGIIAGTGFIPTTEKGRENGVATLDENGKILLEQIPDDIFIGGNEGNGSGNATGVVYDNKNSGLTATNVQAAIDELASEPSVPDGVTYIDFEDSEETGTLVPLDADTFAGKPPEYYATVEYVQQLINGFINGES